MYSITKTLYYSPFLNDYLQVSFEIKQKILECTQDFVVSQWY